MGNLETTINQIEKLYGKGSVMYLDGDQIVDCPVISTGSISIDSATIVGGIPRGRVSEIIGPEASGKTSLSLHVIAEAQKKNIQCAFIDAEHALDLKYAENLSINLKKLILSQVDSGEQALDIAEKLMQSKEVGCVVIDSVAALVPEAELNGDIGDPQIAVQARMMSQALRRFSSLVKKTNTALIFINQIRSKIGVTFGSKEETPGGKALKFYASMRIDMRNIGSIKEDENVVGHRTKVKIIKNKLAPPFKVCEVEFRYGIGIDFIKELIDIAERQGVIKKAGAWYTYGEERFQGRKNFRDVLEENKGLRDKLESDVVKGLKEDKPKKKAENKKKQEPDDSNDDYEVEYDDEPEDE